MRVIIPMAGFGKRMRPMTWSRPKPLLNVAGKPVLGHVLDAFVPLNPERVVFIVGWLGEQVREYVGSHYAFEAAYTVQEELKGQAHALYLAREHLVGPCVIAFVDTLFEADLTGLEAEPADGVIFVKEVEDPRRFGVVVEEGGRITRLIEKPSTTEHRKVMVGLYYVREGRELVRAIERLLAQDIQTKGEFYLADALQLMINEGARLVSRPVSVWEDCGTPEALLHTNRYLLEHGYTHGAAAESALVIPPVHIAPSARIEHAVIGPYVTIGEHAHIVSSVIQDAIIDEGASVRNAVIQCSLIGRNAAIVGPASQYNVGDDTMIDLSGGLKVEGTTP